MSASAGGGHQPSQSRAIPTRTVAISDAAQLPQDYCTTPGGTLFSTTPGGEPRPACPPSRLARGTACSANSFLSAARTAGCRPCTLRGGGLPLELSLRAFRGGPSGRRNWRGSVRRLGLAELKSPETRLACTLLASPRVNLLDSIVYLVGGVTTG